jgi:60 kDa SS-A/Ro ribonucleoprotein
MEQTTTVNNSGQNAYELTASQALAQLAVTGIYKDALVANGLETSTLLGLAEKCDPEFVAKVAIYSRNSAFMKDAPALLTAWLSCQGHTELVKKIFPRVINNTKMLRNYVNYLRGGGLGRKSLGSAPKKLIQNWLANKDEISLFTGSIGNKPSLADVIKMSHPKSISPERDALYKYLLNKDYDHGKLPSLIQSFESWKKNPEGNPPAVNFEMLTSFPLTDDQWKSLARNATWKQIKLNLNTFLRHNVYSDLELVEFLSRKLSDKDQIKKAKVMPYELMAAYLNVDPSIPAQLKEALNLAMEHATDNVPSFTSKLVLMPDVSGSMHWSITRGAQIPSKIRAIDIAGLLTAAFLRKNPEAEILPFDVDVVRTVSLSAKNTILSNATNLTKVGGGGTRCSAPLEDLNKREIKADICVFISDNESNLDPSSTKNYTSVMTQWDIFKSRNPNAYLVCIDTSPRTNAQAPSGRGIINVGGFSDSVFDTIHAFAATQGIKTWVNQISEINL